MATLPRILPLSALLWSLVAPAAAAGDTPVVGAPPSDALLRAALASPGAVAAAREFEAARARAGAAGRLADPEVEAMGSRMVGPMGERGTMWELTVRQPLPRRGEVAADRERARARIAMAGAGHARMTGEIAAEAAMALAEAEGAAERIRILEAQRERLEAVLRGIEARLATGGARLAERLTVETRLASMQLMIEEERIMAGDAAAAARAVLGLAADRPLPAYAAPEVAEISPEHSAARQLAAARAEEAGAMAHMARASTRPMTAVGLRLERERSAMGDASTVGLAVMTDLPWRARGYARAESTAAGAERAAARAEALAADHRIQAALTRVERAARLAASARRLAADILSRNAAEQESLLAGAAAGGMGGATVIEIVELLEKAADAALQVTQAETAERLARAELWRHLPVARFSIELSPHQP